MRMLIAGLEAEIPSNFPSFFRHGQTINRKHGGPHELDAYGLYLALRALELRDGLDFEAERKQIVRAVQARQRECDGFWFHEHHSGAARHSNTRSTASALQLLFEAYCDGLINDRGPILAALDMHLAHSDRLENGGLWFLHDSFELESAAGQPWPDLIRASVWGSSERNGLVFNTHVNTLVMLLHAFDTVLDLDEPSVERYAASFHSGVSALDYVLHDRRRGLAHGLLERLDCMVRRQTLGEFGSRSAGPGIGHRLRCHYYWNVRPRWKPRFPTFRYRDGYLDRSVSLKGSLGFNYHTLNTSDLTRLAVRLDAMGMEAALAQQLRGIARQGLEFAFTPHYQTFVDAAISGSVPGRRSGFSVQLCEALRTFFAREELITGPWIERYTLIRRRVPPSPALLGYDPVTIARPLARRIGVSRKLGIDPQTTDLIVLAEGRYLVIHFGEGVCRLPQPVSERLDAAWLGERSQLSEGQIQIGPGSAVLLQSCHMRPPPL